MSVHLFWTTSPWGRMSIFRDEVIKAQKEVKFFPALLRYRLGTEHLQNICDTVSFCPKLFKFHLEFDTSYNVCLFVQQNMIQDVSTMRSDQFRVTCYLSLSCREVSQGSPQ